MPGRAADFPASAAGRPRTGGDRSAPESRPGVRVWPSVNKIFCMIPLICVRTVTVASGVTVPKAGMRNWISPEAAVATDTATGPFCTPRPGRPAADIGCLCWRCLARTISSNKTPAAMSNATQCRRMNVLGLALEAAELPIVGSFITASPHTRTHAWACLVKLRLVNQGRSSDAQRPEVSHAPSFRTANMVGLATLYGEYGPSDGPGAAEAARIVLDRLERLGRE